MNSISMNVINDTLKANQTEECYIRQYAPNTWVKADIKMFGHT